MAKTIKSPVASRTRSKKCTAITKKKNIFAATVNLIRLSKNEILAATANGLTNGPKYNLRKRNEIDKSATSQKKKKTATSNVVATIDHMPASRLWTILKKENKLNIEKDMCCLAKMRMYSPWPAIVLQVNGKTVEVYFFGEGTTGKIAASEIVPFNQCVDLAKKYFKIKGYLRAVREMELMQNIPHHLSLTKDSI